MNLKMENFGNSEQIDNIEIDSEEVAELLNEILSVLSREQKICVTGFYFEGKNQKEISEILGESEETINNYLLLAGKEMEEKVSELEKMQKLRRYGLSPFTFFLFLRATESVRSVDFDLLEELSSTEMAKLLEEQRTWIAEKEKAIKEIGEISDNYE